MIASLGMYDLPELKDVNNRLWAQIRQELGFGPPKLDRKTDLWEIWQSPDLLLAQTCGYPYRAQLHQRVQLVGTPDYGLPDCPPGYYYSLFVVRSDSAFQTLADLDQCCLAYNEPLSQSGWAGPIETLL